MSNTASLELCNKLDELSGWNPNDKYWYRIDGKWSVHCGHEFKIGKEITEFTTLSRLFPAYDLGYLLRKFPYKTDLRQLRNEWSISWSNSSYRLPGDARREAYGRAESPEDAACSLAIELFKSGVLK